MSSPSVAWARAQVTSSGMRFSLVDAARCRQLEPGLSPETALAAAIHLP